MPSMAFKKPDFFYKWILKITANISYVGISQDFIECLHLWVKVVFQNISENKLWISK